VYVFTPKKEFLTLITDVVQMCPVFFISSPGAVFTTENHTLAIISFYFRVMAVCSAERKKRGLFVKV